MPLDTSPGQTQTVLPFLTATNLKAWNFDPRLCLNSQTLVTQLIETGGPVYLYAGTVVSSIWVSVSVIATGAAPTLIKLGLWNNAATPVCLGVTANLAADARWTAAVGYVKSDLTSPVTVSASGFYYPAWLINGAFGGTALRLNGATTGSGNGAGAQIGTGPYMTPSLGSGKTDMAVNDTGAYAVQNVCHWFGVS